MKNYIILVESKGYEAKETKLYNFSQVNYMFIDGIGYLRVLCDSKFYFFRSTQTYIKEIKICKEK